VGGVIALEMALQLQSRGTSTAVLALIDSYLPRASVLHGKSGNGQEHVAQLLAFAHDLGISPVRFAINEQLLKSLEQTTIMEIVQQAKQLGSLPLDFDGAVAQHLFEVFKANYAAVWKYIPSPYQGKITYFLAQNGASKAPAAVTVWNSLARAGMDWHVVPADHYTILNKANSELIAKKLTRCIAEVESGLTSHNL
jgi:thioesterase domain-containing protein